MSESFLEKHSGEAEFGDMVENKLALAVLGFN